MKLPEPEHYYAPVAYTHSGCVSYRYHSFGGVTIESESIGLNTREGRWYAIEGDNWPVDATGLVLSSHCGYLGKMYLDMSSIRRLPHTTKRIEHKSEVRRLTRMVERHEGNLRVARESLATAQAALVAFDAESKSMEAME